MHWLIFYFAFVSKLYLWNMLNNECLPCSYAQSMDVDKVLVSLDKPASAFKGGFYAYVTSTKILWTLAYLLIPREPFLFSSHVRIQRGGGQGGLDLPPSMENLKAICFLMNTGPNLLKITKLSSHHSMFCHHHETLFKWHFSRGPMMAHFWLYTGSS